MAKVDEQLRSLIPPLFESELEILESSILAEGVRDPVVVWEGQDVIVDGHNRHAICEKHGLSYPTVEMPFDDRDAVIQWMCENQLGRRNLTDAARSDLRGKLYRQLKKREGRPEKLGHNDPVSGPTDERVARREGVSPKTVKRDAEYSEALDTLEELGVQRQEFTSGQRNVRKNHVLELAKTAKEDPDLARDAWQRVKVEGPKAGSIKEAMRSARNERATHTVKQTEDELVSIQLGDFYTESSSIADESIDAIITDPPYPQEFLHTWSQMGEVAMRVLKPGGWCIAYSGKLHLDEVMVRLRDEGLSFYWQIVFQQTVQGVIHPRKVNTTYKPILLFQKPPITKPDSYFQDTIRGGGVEKQQHEWQQSVDGFAWLIDKFTNVGDRILEPFAGGGTCLMAARDLSRYAIGFEIDEAAHASATQRLFGSEGS